VPHYVAHEYSHGLPFYSHFDNSGYPVGMVYQGESGALNEDQADLYSELFKNWISGTNDWIWRSGFANEFIDFANPPSSMMAGSGATGWPDRYYSPLTYCGTGNFGGVHWNSTILTKAAYLLAMGDHFNGCTVKAIGRDRVEQIWYRAVTQYYSRTATFNEAYADLIQAATDLYGAGSDEVRQTTRALQAVELDQPGYCSGIPGHPPEATDVPPGPLTVTPAGPNLVLSWPPVPWLAGEPVLLSSTNLTTGPWTALTGPLTTNVVTVPTTGAAQYFRLRIP
jgi:hypothetical protein